jgi:subtilase family serine protease
MSTPWHVKTGGAIVCACALLALAPAQAAERHVLKGHVLPAFAKAPLVGAIDPNAQLHLAIGLPVRDPAGLQAFVGAVSDPSSPMYGRYLTPAQFVARFAPSASDYQVVTAFARAHGLNVSGTHRNRIVLDVTASAQTIERAFSLTLQRRKRADNTIFFAPDREPTLDTNVPILHIQGLDNFIRPKINIPMGKVPPAPRGGSGDYGIFVGSDYRNAYAPGTTLTGAGQSVGLLEFDGFYPNDPVQYQMLYTNTNVPITTVSSTQSPLPAGSSNMEVALDIEMAISMAPGLSSVIVYETPYATGAAPSDTVLALMAYPPTGVPVSLQLGASWSFPVDVTSSELTLEMASQGQSFLASSGDLGATYLASGYDLALPFTTFVGGTNLYMAIATRTWDAEDAWNGSGGGALTDVPFPSYQTGVVNAQNLGFAHGRNVPDVAMVGDQACCYIVYNNGTNINAGGGTSLATALWAGFMALANQQRANEHAAPVGFFNPLLYATGLSPAYAADFHDIISGTNHQAGTNGQGYPAVAGYDLVTGWGTPAGLLNNFPLPTPPPPTPDPYAAECNALVQQVNVAIRTGVRERLDQWSEKEGRLRGCLAVGALSQVEYNALVQEITTSEKNPAP